MNKIGLIGDVHGDFEHLNNLIDKHKNDVDCFIQAGDLGYFPNFPEYKNRFENFKPSKKLYFIDGNHDNHEELQKYNTVEELTPNVNYCPRGTIITLDDGRKILLVGGAASLDASIRTMGVDWWQEEIIGQKQGNKILDKINNENLDIIISHTCPKSIKLKLFDRCLSFNDPTEDFLEIILETKKPSMWYFGHFHMEREGKINDTYWRCLDINEFLIMK